jgi:hypothetical protein
MITLYTLFSIPALYGLYRLFIKKKESRRGFIEAYGLIWLSITAVVIFANICIWIVTNLP